MKWTMCFLLWILVSMAGCSDQEGSGHSHIPLPDSEPVVLNLIAPAPDAFDPVQANQIVFDMTYRGLSGPDDDFFFPYGYGYRGSEEDTPFIKDLKRHGIRKIRPVLNLAFKDAGVSALDVRKNRPVAFHVDLDGNGKVTAKGIYSVTLTQDTGPLGGTLETTSRITIE